MEEQSQIDTLKIMGDIINSLKQFESSSIDWQDVVLKELYNSIKFKNPEKINGAYHKSGYEYGITYIGRDLTLEGDNYTWQIVSNPSKTNTAKLSVFKYQDAGMKGIDVLIKTLYSTEKKIVDRKLFDNPDWIINTLIESVDELPF